MIVMDKAYYSALPNFAWIAQTIPKTVLEGIVKDIQVEEQKPKIEKSDSFVGFEDVIYFRSVGELGFYCRNPKGYLKARRAFVHGIEERLFESNKKGRDHNHPVKFPCIVKFHVVNDKVQILYKIDSSQLSVLEALTVNK